MRPVLHTFLIACGEDLPVLGSETATAASRGRLPRAAVWVAGLVLVSTAARFAAAQAFTTPWIAPDEMVYGLIGESLWTDGTMTVRGLRTPYYSLLTPALVGGPLAWFGLEDGIQGARVLQALAMSLVAVPTYLWTRRITTQRWAVAAATLVLVAPALHYSGFLMTEPLTLTVVTAALLSMAHALERPSAWRYGVFVAWATAAASVRLQALVLLPAFLLAALIDAAAARDTRRLRPLMRLGGVAIGAAVLVAAVVLLTGGELSTRRLLGAYTPVGEGNAVATGWLDEVAWHAFDLSVLGLGLAALATAALAATALSRRDTDPALRTFVSVTLGYLSLLVVQVALFSAAFVGHVAERYLVTAVPLLAIGLCAWAARGAPRAPAVVVPIWIALVVGAVFVPPTQLVEAGTLVNTLTPAPLAALGSADEVHGALVAIAAVAGLVVLLVPRRLAWSGVLAVGIGLTLISIDTGRRVAAASENESRVTIGSEPPSWIDAAGLEDVTLLANGDRLWTATARTVFWNRAIDNVVRVAPATLPFPPATSSVELGEDGVLLDADGRPLERRLVVAPTTMTLDGEILAERPAGDSESYGLAAWRTTGPARIILALDGFLPNGDFGGTAHVTVFGCRPGTLEITILGKSGDPIDVRSNGVVITSLDTPAEEAVTHRIRTPGDADGSLRCVFELENPGYAGSTTIAFTPD